MFHSYVLLCVCLAPAVPENILRLYALRHVMAILVIVPVYNVSVTSIGLTRETIEWERNERMIITLYIIYQTIIHLEQYVMICG